MKVTLFDDKTYSIIMEQLDNGVQFHYGSYHPCTHGSRFESRKLVRITHDLQEAWAYEDQLSRSSNWEYIYPHNKSAVSWAIGTLKSPEDDIVTLVQKWANYLVERAKENQAHRANLLDRHNKHTALLERRKQDVTEMFHLLMQAQTVKQDATEMFHLLMRAQTIKQENT